MAVVAGSEGKYLIQITESAEWVEHGNRAIAKASGASVARWEVAWSGSSLISSRRASSLTQLMQRAGQRGIHRVGLGSID